MHPPRHLAETLLLYRSVHFISYSWYAEWETGRSALYSPDNHCKLFGKPERPAVYNSLLSSEEMCGHSTQEAFVRLTFFERATTPSMKLELSEKLSENGYPKSSDCDRSNRAITPLQLKQMELTIAVPYTESAGFRMPARRLDRCSCPIATNLLAGSSLPQF